MECFSVTADPRQYPAGTRIFALRRGRQSCAAELHIDNNLRALPLDLIGPNLTVTAASVAPPAGNLGDQFSVSYTIANQGTADAVGLDMGPGGEFGWNDHIYFSIDQTWDGSDTLVSENLAPGVF